MSSPDLTDAEREAVLAVLNTPMLSMGPKIEASIAFVSKPGRRAIICDPPSLAAALDESAGTIVVHST